MNALVWRLHRNQAVLAACALAALTAVLAITGIAMANEYHHFLATCGATRSRGSTDGLLTGFGTMSDLVGVTLLVPVAYSIFAVALGIAAGAAFRRIIPAMAMTITGFAMVRFLIAQYGRPQYLPPLLAQLSLTAGPAGASAPAGSWILSENLVGPGGSSSFPAACGGGTGPKISITPQCLAEHGFHMQEIYQPASRFWAFQGIESGIFLLLAAALIAVAAWLILAREA